MSSSFQPIPASKPAKAASEKFRLKVLPQAATTPAFNPIGPKKTAPSEPSSQSAADPACPSASTVTLERDGDHVKIVHVKCGCGKTTSLQCDY